MSKSFRGVFTIPSTPFDEQLEVDWEGLRRIVDFCVECGAHGIVWPVNASSFATLSDEERLKGMRVVVERVAGRIPVVIGTQGVSVTHAMMFSRHANDIGADAVIAMTPYIQKLSGEDTILEYYRGISSVVDLPIFIQNHDVGNSLSVKTLVRLIQEVEHVEYIKEETMYAAHKLTQVLEMLPGKVKGVFGGMGGHYLLLEYPRGVAGNMPGCHITDVIVRLWNALEAGEVEEAKRIFGLIAPMFAIETALRGVTYPEVLRRRGVIKSARQRAEHCPIDEYDHRALDDALKDLESLFTWHGF